MMLTILTQNSSIADDFLAELRDVEIQKDRQRFRKNVERVGEILAYEVSKHLPRASKEVQTPLAKKTVSVLDGQPVLATVLRAGLALHQGFLNYFNHADNAYVSAFRKHTSNHEFEIVIEYLASPVIEGRTLILIDPMLATGRSMFLTYKALLTKGKPARVFVVSLIGSQQGIAYIQKHMPDAHIFIGTVDPALDAHSYIMPGLGDAGDLSYGEKI
ncbi:MAG: uracil phosphoribosyltransferase [bacterium]|nr:uracil phosphoribosyltransferase [bacterium]